MPLRSVLKYDVCRQSECDSSDGIESSIRYEDEVRRVTCEAYKYLTQEARTYATTQRVKHAGGNEIESNQSGTLKPSDIQAGHGTHAFRIRSVALLQDCTQTATNIAGVIEMFCLRKARVLLQNPMRSEG